MRRARPACKRKSAGGDFAAVDFDRFGRNELSASLNAPDTAGSKVVDRASRNWIRKCAFEAHQFRPVDARVARDSFAAHAPRPVDKVACARQHPLGIAAAQGTGAAEWFRIDDGYGLACLPTGIG